MTRLFLLILTISVGSCAGVAVIAVLVMGYYTWQAILLWGAVGAAVGVAVAWFVAKRLHEHEVARHPEDPEGLLDDNPQGLPRK